jgi:hypothetical protein
LSPSRIFYIRIHLADVLNEQNVQKVMQHDLLSHLDKPRLAEALDYDRDQRLLRAWMAERPAGKMVQ